MKRNIFEYESSEDETEVKKPRKLMVDTTQDASIPIGSARPDSRNYSGSESDIDYTTMKLPDNSSSAAVTSTAAKKASVNTPIVSSIGLQMMQKMGFKLGDTLGKVDEVGKKKALSEPISVRVKTDRKGIGATRVPESVSFHQDEYRMTAKEKHTEMKNKKYLLQLQRFCFHESGDDIAISEGLDVDKVNVMWREVARGVLRSEGRTLLFGEDVGIGLDKHDQKVQSVDKDQTERVDTDQDVGEINKDHLTNKDTEILEYSPNDFDTLTITEQLHLLLSYTRQTFFYCPHCSVKYESKEAMLHECPGPFERYHPDLL